MDTSSSARYQLSNKRTLNGTLCCIAASSSAQCPNRSSSETADAASGKPGPPTRQDLLPYGSAPVPSFSVGMARSGKCVWTNSSHWVQLFVASIQPEVDGKTHGATDIVACDRIVRERIRRVAMIVMAIDIVEQTAHMLTQSIIENQRGVGLRTAYCFRLLEEIGDPTIIDAALGTRALQRRSERGWFCQHSQGHSG